MRGSLVEIASEQVIQPNVILFYVDDLGWQDTPLNDLDDPCPYETPNISALAESGMNFPLAYSPAPTCAPSRGAIMTGQHPAKTRYTNVTTNDRSAGDANNLLIDTYIDEQLDPTLLTIADALKWNGYGTGLFGKWHIGLTAASYGFDTVSHDRGVHRSMKPNRNALSAFGGAAADGKDDTYPLSTEKYPPYTGPDGDEYISENEPLRGKKGNVTDGGIRVPMVVAGPGITGGSEFDSMVTQLDYFPTFLSLTDTTIPEEDLNELNGADLEPVLHGTGTEVIDPQTEREREYLFWHFPHYGTMYAALRSGDYKLHMSYETGNYELYRLANDGVRVDIEELVDLAGDPAYAGKLAELSSMLDEALAANNAEFPYFNPSYTGRTEDVAIVDSSWFEALSRQARVTIDGDGPKIVEAWVIYISPLLKPGDEEVVTEAYMGGMRADATVSANGYSVSATRPSSIDSYCFMLVDENGFMQYTDVNSKGAGGVESPNVTLPSALAYWTLDETSGSIAADVVHGYDATVTGAEWSVGVDGGALYFDGSFNDFAAIPEEAVSSLDTQVSVGLWAYGGATQPVNDVAFYAVDAAGQKLMDIHLPWKNSKVIWDAGKSDRLISETISTDFIKGKWNHWVFTKDTTTGAPLGSMKIYLNGDLLASGTGNIESLSGLTQAWLGGSGGLSTNPSYEGLLDEVVLYDVALTDDQVEALYRSYAPPSDYQTWLLDYPELSDVSFEGDPEQYGIATGLEFVLNGTPTESGEVILPVMDAAEENFVFSFIRRAESVAYTQQFFQYGSDLAEGWTDLSITDPRDANAVSLGPIVGGLQEVRVTIPKTLAVDGKLFGRLRVESVD